MKTWLRITRFFETTCVALVILAAILAASITVSKHVEDHIDATIAKTVKQAEQQGNNQQAKTIKALTDALEKQAVPAIIQECNIIKSLHGECPTVNIQVNP